MLAGMKRQKLGQGAYGSVHCETTAAGMSVAVKVCQFEDALPLKVRDSVQTVPPNLLKEICLLTELS